MLDSLFPPYTQPPITWWDNLGNAFLALTVVEMVAFVISYGVFFNWRKTRAGKGIFFLFCSILLVLARSLISLITGGADYPGRDLLHWLVEVLPWAAMTYLLFVLWTNYFQGVKLLELWRRPRKNKNATTLKDGEQTLTRRRKSKTP